MVELDAKRLFEAIVRDHADMLWSYLGSVVRDRAAAEELFQETLMTAWSSLDRYDPKLPFGPWLRGIAGRLMLAQRRKLAKDLLRTTDAQDLEALGTLFDRVAARSGDIWEEKLDVLRLCLEELPEPQREVIRAYYWDDLDCRGIAARLMRPLEAIKKRLQRGRSALAECMQIRMSSPKGLS